MIQQTMDAEMIRVMTNDWSVALIVILAIVGAVVCFVHFVTNNGGSDAESSDE